MFSKQERKEIELDIRLGGSVHFDRIARIARVLELIEVNVRILVRFLFKNTPLYKIDIGLLDVEISCLYVGDLVAGLILNITREGVVSQCVT